MARKIEVEIVGDSRSLERAFKRSSNAAKDFNRNVSKTGRLNQAARGGLTGVFGGKASLLFGSGAFIGAAAAGTAFKATVTEASNLEEQMNRTRVVFDESGDAMLRWSQDSATAMGMARSEALRYSADIAGILQTSGLAEDATARMSQEIVQLAADMASFNNEDPAEMLERLRSGLVGETEPLRRFGVLLSENRVKAEAYATGIAKTGAVLTDAQKVQARYSIILQDSAKQQGDFERTSESFANQMRILQANVQDAAGAVGTALLPAVTDLVEAMNDGVAAAEDLAGAIKSIPELPDWIDVDWGAGFGAAVDFVPGIQQARQLADGVGIVRDLVVDVHDEAAKPLNFDFSAVNQLTRSMDIANDAVARYIANAQRAATAGPTGATTYTPEQRNQWFDARTARAFERAQNVGDLRKIAQQIQARIAVTKDITRRLKLEDDLWRVMQEILRRQAQTKAGAAAAAEDARDAAVAAAEDARAAAKARAAAAAEAAQMRIETRTGWLEFGIERAEATESVRDDVKAWRALEAFLLERIRQEGRTLDLMRDLWRTRQRIRDLNEQQSDKDPLAGLMQVSTQRLTGLLAAGTGLTGAGRKVLAANISGQQIQVYNRIELDGQQVARTVTTQQARGGQRTGKQTSGRRG